MKQKQKQETYLVEILKAIELVMIYRQGYLLRKKFYALQRLLGKENKYRK